MADIDILAALLFTGLSVVAVLRRPDRITITLALTCAASIYLGQIVPVAKLPGLFATLDMLTAVIMLTIWTTYRSRRAQLVGFLAMVKCAWAVLFTASLGNSSWLIYAIVLNAGFVAQVIVAGGMADGLVSFFDRIDPSTVSKRRGRNDHVGTR
jgi:energy-coupling factor transporter transmembrane protein EcfT